MARGLDRLKAAALRAWEAWLAIQAREEERFQQTIEGEEGGEPDSTGETDRGQEEPAQPPQADPFEYPASLDELVRQRQKENRGDE